MSVRVCVSLCVQVSWSSSLMISPTGTGSFTLKLSAGGKHSDTFYAFLAITFLPYDGHADREEGRGWKLPLGLVSPVSLTSDCSTKCCAQHYKQPLMHFALSFSLIHGPNFIKENLVLLKTCRGMREVCERFHGRKEHYSARGYCIPGMKIHK